MARFYSRESTPLLVMYILAGLVVGASIVRAQSRISAPEGCVVVSKSATGNHYSTISAAVASLSTSTTGSQCIFVDAGTYLEQVVIPTRSAQLTIYGYTTDTASYTSNAATISYNLSLATAGSDDASGTVRNQAASTKFYNINIANTYGQGSQAIALSAYNEKQGYYGCAFTGYQDTLLAETGTQIYAKSLIQGHTDFIFGQHSPAWFQSCDISVLSASSAGPCITASGRSSSSDANWYVFDSCNIDAASGNSVSAGAYYLGRPWSEYARVTFQNSTMSNVISPAGWSQWSSSEPNTEDVTFEEFDNSGAGASGTRANFSEKIGNAVSISSILGTDYATWVDANYL